jgi:integrase
MDWAPLASQPVEAVTRRAISARLREISTAQGPVAAARARAALSAFYNWAISEGYEIQSNPVQGSTRAASTPSRTRVLTPAELRSIWLACRGDDYGRIIRLLILTGQRRGEIGGARWGEINGDVWTLPAARAKNHREHPVPLTPAALALLPPQRLGRDFLFGISPRGFSNWATAKDILDARCGVRDWVVHDIRRSVATGMAELGVLPHIIEVVLNHMTGHRSGVAGIYQRARYTIEMRDALCTWADHVEALTRPEAP